MTTKTMIDRATAFAPWEFENDEDTLENWLIRDDEGGVIAILPKGPTNEIKERQLARARLMAAAPELLDALQGIVNASNANPEPIHFKIREAISTARDAISKAIDFS